MQRDSDTADTGNPRIVLSCVKGSIHKFEKSVVSETVISVLSEYL